MNDQNKKNSITTKSGDSGRTRLLDQKQIKKSDSRPEAYGTLDEAHAFIGLARVKTTIKTTQGLLLTIQKHIYLINSELACPPESLSLLKEKIKQDHLKILEQNHQEIEPKLDLPKKFVLYGQDEVSAILDVARAVVRRAERNIVRLYEDDEIKNPLILPYINRLSDVLYVLARYEEHCKNIPYSHAD